MKALHVICRRDESGKFRLLEPVEGLPNGYRSSCWRMESSDAPSDLVGGWLYLHSEGKSEESDFGGVVKSFEPCPHPESDLPGWAFTFVSDRRGRGQKWRGKDYGMARMGGLVEATLRHEKEPPDADRT